MRCQWLGGGCDRRAVYIVENMIRGVTLELCRTHMRDYLEGLRLDVGAVEVLEVRRRGGKPRRLVIGEQVPEVEVAAV
ncbi:MAG: hypothetical protein QW420_03105 [Candidatus Caldarchaeum sp.]